MRMSMFRGGGSESKRQARYVPPMRRSRRGGTVTTYFDTVTTYFGTVTTYFCIEPKPKSIATTWQYSHRLETTFSLNYPFP